MSCKNIITIIAGVVFCVLASFASAQCPQICDTNLGNTAFGSFALANNTTGQTYDTTQTYTSSHSSAEWVEEAPSGGRGGVLPLDNFGTIQFTVDKANQDFGAFGIISNDGDTLKSVQIAAVTPADFKEVKQIEFSLGDPIDPPTVPEPTSMALLGVGLLGLGVTRYRRKTAV